MPFSYFGSKHGLAPHYPPPGFGTIVEPFAGAAGYSVYWARPGQRVFLYDKDPAVVALWETLMGASIGQVLSDCEEQLAAGQATHPFLTMIKGSGVNRVSGKATERVNDFMRVQWGQSRRRILGILPLVQSGKWSIECRSYDDLDNRRAVWFIDPPYKPYNTNAGSLYGVGASGIDYDHLATWCKTRSGQVIVCEQQPADWLPFRPFRRQTAKATSVVGGSAGSHERVEVIWSRTPGHALGRTGFTSVERERATERRRVRRAGPR